jgi:hypothetical protein
MHLLATVPTHSGAIESVTAETLLQLQALLHARGGRFETRFPSASDISVLRNMIVADFLHSGADALFMLDADQGLPGEAVLRMLDLGAEVVGCLYPKRRFDWAAVRPTETAAHLDRILHQASEYVGALEAAESGEVEVRAGFARALYVGAGALVVRRSAFDRLRNRYPDLRDQGFNAEEFAAPRFAENWGFFNRLPPAPGHPALSEDFAFCRRWREAGGEIWADIATTTAHVGRHMFTGSYADHLQAHGRR